MLHVSLINDMCEIVQKKGLANIAWITSVLKRHNNINLSWFLLLSLSKNGFWKKEAV